MTSIIENRILYSIFFYCLIVLLLYVSKSNIFFKDGKLRHFGTDTGETLFSFGAIAVVLSVSTYYIFAAIDSIFGKQ